MCNKDVGKAKENERKSTKGKQRPAYKRRVKPPYSYVELITMAIKSASNKMKTLREILDYMQTKFPCFRGSYVGWKNSVRHNLSAADCFTKVLRNEQRPYGKDNYWTMNSNCKHCINMASGRPAPRRKESASAATTPIPISISTASDHQGYAVHDWVANQASIIRVPSSNPSDSQVQYIELRHTNRVEQNPADISKFDFQSSVCRVNPVTYQEHRLESNQCPTSRTSSSSSAYESWTSHHSDRFDSRTSSRVPSSSSGVESWATRSLRFDSHSSSTTRPSSSSISESWASSGFESSSDNFDLEMPSTADNLDTIVDDLFVPDDDIDLSLYGDWPHGNHGDQVTKTEDDESVNAGINPASPWSTHHPSSPYSSSSTTSEIRTHHPSSPYSTSSTMSEIRTSITPQPSDIHIMQQQQSYAMSEHPSSPASQWSCHYPSSPYSTSSNTSETRTNTTPHPPSYQSMQHAPSHQQSHLQRSPYNAEYVYQNIAPLAQAMENDDEVRHNAPRYSSSSASLQPSLHSPKILPTFETMLTSAVRDSLNLDFESVEETMISA